MPPDLNLSMFRAYDIRTPAAALKPELAGDWLQVCQRISQSEDRLARWEVVGARAELVREAKQQIAACVRRFGAGEEYWG